MLYTEFKSFDGERYQALHKEDGTECPAILQDGSLEVLDTSSVRDTPYSYAKVRDLLMDIESRASRLRSKLWNTEHGNSPEYASYDYWDSIDDEAEELTDWANEVADRVVSKVLDRL